MPKRIQELLAVGLLAFALALVAFGPAQAHEGDHTVLSETTTNTTTKSEAELKAERDARIEKFKTDLKTKLTAAKQTRLKARCKAAQGVITAFGTKVKANVPNRVRAYENALNHLDKFIDKAKTASLDTTTLESQQTVLKQKIDAYKADLDEFQQAIGDLKDVDCVADPTGFQAALEAARTMRQGLIDQVNDIAKYVKETIKPTLVSLRTQLEAQTDNSSTGTGEEQ